MYNLISIATGFLITIMIAFNGVLASHVGNYTSTVIIHMSGLFIITLILILTKSKLNYVKNMPLYIYCGGIIGVFTVLFNTLSFSALGMSITLALGLLGQSLASVIIDHYGLLGMKKCPFNTKKSIGFIVVCVGILCMAFS